MRISSPGLFVVVAVTLTPYLQAQSPFVYSVNNAASYDSTAIAQGSMFVVFGNFIGPATLAQATMLPLPNTIAGFGITVTSGTVKLNCPLFYVSNGQSAAVLPSNTPPGAATITVTYNGAASSFASTTINVVPSSAGVFSITSTGLGTGIFTDALTGVLKTYSNPATPGELLTAWATGLGPITTPDNNVPPSFPSFPNVQLWMGNQAAPIQYAGRSGCCVAIDQINFHVPQTVTAGCNVPVTIVSGGKSSNTTTIPISAAGAPCSDSAPTVPSTLLTSAAAGQPLKVGMVAIGPSVLPGDVYSASSRQAQLAADRLSEALHVKVPVEDAIRIMRAADSHNIKALRDAMAKYAPQWKALSAKAKARLTEAAATGSRLSTEAILGTVTNESLTAAFVSAQLPPAGSCVVMPSPLPRNLGATVRGLNAGSSLSMIGPAGSLTLQPQSTGYYQAAIGSAVTGPDIPTGTYTISSIGGADLGPFSVTVTVSGHLTLSNKSALSTVDRTQPLTVTWTGGTSGQFALIAGYASNGNTGLPPQIFSSKARFVCAANASQGTLTIPPYILSSMWPTPDGSGLLLIGTNPLSQPISIPGLDAAFFVDGSSDSTSVIFK